MLLREVPTVEILVSETMFFDENLEQSREPRSFSVSPAENDNFQFISPSVSSFVGEVSLTYWDMSSYVLPSVSHCFSEYLPCQLDENL